MTHVQVPSAELRIPSPGPGPLAIVGRAIEAHGKKLAQQSENLQVAKFGADLLELDDQAREAAGKAEPQAAEQIYSGQLDQFEKTIDGLGLDAQNRARILFEQRRALGEIAVKRDARQRTTDLHISQANRRINLLMERVTSGSIAEQQISLVEIDETLDSLVESGDITRPERFNKQTEIKQEIRQRQKDEAFVALDRLITDTSVAFAAAGSDEQRSSIQNGFDKIVDAARSAGDINTKQAAKFKSEFRAASGRRLSAKGASILRRLNAEFQAGNGQQIELLKEEISGFPKGQMRKDLEVETNTLLQRLVGINSEVSTLFDVLAGTVDAPIPQRASTLNKAYQSIKGRGEDPIIFITQLLEHDSALPPDYVKDLKTLAKPESLDLMSLRNHLMAIRGVSNDEAERIAKATGILGDTAYQVTKSLDDPKEVERRINILSSAQASNALAIANVVLAGGDNRKDIDKESDPLDIKRAIRKQTGLRNPILSAEQVKNYNANFRYRFTEQKVQLQQADNAIAVDNAQKISAEDLESTNMSISIPGTGQYFVDESIFSAGTVASPTPTQKRLSDATQLFWRTNLRRFFSTHFDPVADIRPDLSFRANGVAYMPVVNDAGPVSFLKWDIERENMTDISPDTDPGLFAILRDQAVRQISSSEMVSNAHLHRRAIHGDTPLSEVDTTGEIRRGIRDERTKQWLVGHDDMPRTDDEWKEYEVGLESLSLTYNW